MASRRREHCCGTMQPACLAAHLLHMSPSAAIMPPSESPYCSHHSGGPHLGVCGCLRRMVSCCACALLSQQRRVACAARPWHWELTHPAVLPRLPPATARYLSNRLVMWHVHSGTEGGAQELWRGSQAWIWMGELSACRAAAAQLLKSVPRCVMLGWTVVLQLLGLGLKLMLESGGWAGMAWRVHGT